MHTDLKLKIDKCNREISKIKQQIDTIYDDKSNVVIDNEQYVGIAKVKQVSIDFKENTLKNIKKFRQARLCLNSKGLY